MASAAESVHLQRSAALIAILRRLIWTVVQDEPTSQELQELFGDPMAGFTKDGQLGRRGGGTDNEKNVKRSKIMDLVYLSRSRSALIVCRVGS